MIFIEKFIKLMALGAKPGKSCLRPFVPGMISAARIQVFFREAEGGAWPRVLLKRLVIARTGRGDVDEMAGPEER